MNKRILRNTIYFSILTIIACVVYLIDESKTANETTSQFNDQPKTAPITGAATSPASEVAAIETPVTQTTASAVPESIDMAKSALITMTAASHASEVAGVEVPVAQTSAGAAFESKDKVKPLSVSESVGPKAAAPISLAKTFADVTPVTKITAAVAPTAQTAAGTTHESKGKIITAPTTEASASKTTAPTFTAKAAADVSPVFKDKPETAPVTVAAASPAAETAATPADTAIADVVPVSEDKPETAPVAVAAASPAAEVPVVAAEPVAQTTAGAATESKVNADAAPAPVVAEIVAAPRAVNSFSRLFHEPPKPNLPPSEDGIHDSASKGARLLQTPLEAFAALPRSKKGNRVDWVKALDNKQIKPRADRIDSNTEMKIRDVQNVIPVKGSMADVVFSHKIHTQWLACSNCHPDIYAEEAGSNQVNMAAFSRGKGCGICHNKVAFPLSECRKCHSRKKSALAKANVKP